MTVIIIEGKREREGKEINRKLKVRFWSNNGNTRKSRRGYIMLGIV